MGLRPLYQLADGQCLVGLGPQGGHQGRIGGKVGGILGKFGGIVGKEG